MSTAHDRLVDERQEPDKARLERDLDRQRAAYHAHPSPDYRERKRDLARLKSLINDHRDDIIEAIKRDYGNRSRHETQFAELITVTDGIKHAMRHLRSWMKVQRRDIDTLMFPGAKNRVIPQPLGVVGLIIPWNFPINLAFSQLVAVFAAGNRAMVKMSENSIHLTRLLQRVSGDYFPDDKLCFYEETGRTGIAFSTLPFDLMIFTGSGQTGRAVMTAAAANLTPVILELGGKAPAIIDPDYPLERAVQRIVYVKQFNAGQICTNVDYVFVHESQTDAFTALAEKYAQQYCPDIESDDYTSIIDDRAFARLQQTLEDARSGGATVVSLSRSQQSNAQSRKMPLHLVLNTTPDMIIRQQETFGPILLVLPYREPDEVIRYVNSHDRPLALYPFTHNKKLAERYIEHIMSGGVSVNDALLHVAQHDLPFGGVGPSGMGHYHGYEGFVSCSKLRPVFYQSRFSALKYLAPPYGPLATRVYDFLMRFKG